MPSAFTSESSSHIGFAPVSGVVCGLMKFQRIGFLNVPSAFPSKTLAVLPPISEVRMSVTPSLLMS